jgi:dihydroflavonol-4-reductase
MPATTILVTGASGFIGCHCVLDLLNHGYRVRGSVRDLGRTGALEKTLSTYGADTSQLDWVAASLTKPDSWSAAVEGCDAIFHVASPVPTIQPKNPDDVIEPARQGTLNVLEAAASQGINRVVLTSSVTAILGGVSEDRVYTGEDWSDPSDPDMIPYAISKTVAERCAWDFCQSKGISLSTIHPAMVLGPSLENDYGSSLDALVKLLRREVPLLPRFGFEIVDVRDVAGLHRLALENPDAIGQRLIAANGFLWFRDIAALLIDAYPDRRIPDREMPNWLTRLTSLFIGELGTILKDLDVAAQLDNSPAKNLGWQPRTPQEAILSGAKSLIDLGIV